MRAFIEIDHDGRERWIEINSPAMAYLILSHWEGIRTRGVWVHHWYTRVVPHVVDLFPRFRYLTTRRDDESPTAEQAGGDVRWSL